MPKVQLSLSAERYISELSELNPSAARKMIDRLHRQMDLLSSFPEMTERGHIPRTRKVSMRPLILTIRANGNSIEIMAIRHGRQTDALAPSDIPKAGRGEP